MFHFLFKKIMRQPGNKFFCWLLFFLAFSFSAIAQRKCGTPQAVTDALTRDPKLINRLETIEANMKSTDTRLFKEAMQARESSSGDTIIVPVVVHIVLQNPAQISDAQVQSQIDVLNQDYNASNPDTSRVPGVWKSLIGDMVIKYVLAKRTPDGLPTDGIDRVVTNQSSFSINYAAENVKHTATGGANSWNSKEYLNIWVCVLQSGYLGVTTPPGLYPADEDGVVVTSDAFGTIGNLDPEYNKGRTTTHEVGHYWSLLHPWGLQASNPNCTDDDSVNDTPLQSGPIYGCPAFPYTDNCTPNYPGTMFMNFMGYADDSCMNLFTKGQVDRMLSLLYTFRASLLTSEGADSIILQKTDAQLLHLYAPVGKICDGTFSPVVTLRNYGSDTLHSVNITYQNSDGQSATYNWTGALPSFDTVQLSLPALTVNTGQYQMTVFTSDPNDTTDDQVQNDTLTTAFHLDPVMTTSFTEGFEEDTFPPPGWEVINPDGSYTWERTTVASHSGSVSVEMPNLDYAQNGPIDDLVSPVINVSNADSAFLFFYVAAAVQSNPYGNNQYWDTLEVLVSQDCAQSGTVVYKHWGANLMTDSVPTSQEFVPTATQWRRDSINITPYIHAGNFQLVFRNITNFENNIYLDDISVQTRSINPNLQNQDVLVVPNPTSGDVKVEFSKITPDFRSINIYNSSGQFVASASATDVVNNIITLHLGNEPNGLYFVKIIYQDKSIVKKIVKLQ
jgi:Pregnancy-associated plasma protein-A/Secretion system C-terminal sorting domain